MSIEYAPKNHRLKLGRKTSLALRLSLAGGIALSGAGYSQRNHGDRWADISRGVIGIERTAQAEGILFSARDKTKMLYYEISGKKGLLGQSIPAEEEKVEEVAVSFPDTATSSIFEVAQSEPEPPKPAPFSPPETQPLHTILKDGEGVWKSEGLPTQQDDVMIERTFIYPDAQRPSARVDILVFDKRRIQLHMVGGEDSPGGDLGVKGPGRIPDADRLNLLVAWNGGFQGLHGGFGMIANGRQYRPLRSGLASVAITSYGTIEMGKWGSTMFRKDEYVAVRQNTLLLVENCQVTLESSQETNLAAWGVVDVGTSNFVTRRSAIGLTQNGDLLVAAGNDLTVKTLARAMWAAGACTAMQLDINTPQVNTSLYFSQPDGTIKAYRFAGADNPRRFLGTESHDFMYVTRDDTNYKP